MTITTGTIQSASIQVRNDADSEKVYDIVASVMVTKVANEYGSSNGSGQIQNGSVSKDGKTVATWTKWNQISISYQVAGADEQKAILAAVQDFCTAVTEFTGSVTLTATV